MPQDNPYELALQCIPQHQRSIFLPQILQLRPQHIPTRIGFLAHVDSPEGSGIFFAVSLDEHRLATVIRVAVQGTYQLREQPETDYCCIGLMCESSMKMMEQIRASDLPPTDEKEAWSIAPHPATPFYEREQITAFSIKAGSYKFNLAPNTVHSSTCLHLLPGYFDYLDREHPDAVRGLEAKIAENAEYPQAVELRRLLRQFSPRRANQPGALLHYRGLADQVVACFAAHAFGGEAAAEGYARELTEEAMDLIAESLDNPPSIDQLAQALHTSRSHLCARFKRETGMSIGAYASQLRIERAKQLLEQGALDVAEVASQLGYHHQSSFAAAFKRAIGMSPSAWKRVYGRATVDTRGHVGNVNQNEAGKNPATPD